MSLNKLKETDIKDDIHVPLTFRFAEKLYSKCSSNIYLLQYCQ
jgi:hypothetical protein